MSLRTREKEGVRGGGGREMMFLMKMMIGDGLRERVEGRRGEGEAGVVVLMILIQIHLRMMGDVEGRSVGAKWRLLLTPMFQVMTEHALEGVPLSGLMRRRAGNVIIGGKTEVKIDHVLLFFSMKPAYWI